MSFKSTSSCTAREKNPPSFNQQHPVQRSPGSRRDTVCPPSNQFVTLEENQILRELEHILLDQDSLKPRKTKSKKHNRSLKEKQQDHEDAANLIVFDDEELAWLGKGNIHRLMNNKNSSMGNSKPQLDNKFDVSEQPIQQVTDSTTDKQPKSYCILQKAKDLLFKKTEQDVMEEKLCTLTISSLSLSNSIREPVSLPMKLGAHAAREAETQTSARSGPVLAEDKNQSSATCASFLASLQGEFVEHLLKSELELWN